MKVLVVLLATFGLAAVVMKLTTGSYRLRKAARIGMSAMLLFTALGHFMYTEGMTMMLPDFLPLKALIVYLTGILEIAAAVWLHMARLKRLTAWLLILFFILVLPANIYAALHHVDMYKATFHGEGTSYLWFRIPMQLFLIVWVYVFVIRRPVSRRDTLAANTHSMPEMVTHRNVS